MFNLTTKGILSIIASEEGIVLSGREDMKIESLKEGMKDVNVLGRVTRKYSLRSLLETMVPKELS